MKARNTTSLKWCIPSTGAIDRREKIHTCVWRFKFASCKRSIKIQRVFANKVRPDTFLTDLDCCSVVCLVNESAVKMDVDFTGNLLTGGRQNIQEAVTSARRVNSRQAEEWPPCFANVCIFTPVYVISTRPCCQGTYCRHHSIIPFYNNNNNNNKLTPWLMYPGDSMLFQ